MNLYLIHISTRVDSLKDGDSLLTVLEGLVCVESFNALYLYGNKAGDAPLGNCIRNAKYLKHLNLNSKYI